MLRFVFIAVLLALLILGFVMTTSKYGWMLQPSFTIEIVIFLLLSTIFLYLVIARRLGERPTDFVMIYLGTTVLRILLFGVFIFMVIRFDKAGAWRNATLFLVCYFLFTAAEVLTLFYQINSTKKDVRKDA